MLKCVTQHLPPSGRIEQGDPNGMLNKTGHAGCLPGCDKRANLFDLGVIDRDGDLRCRHTKNHTIEDESVRAATGGPN